MKFPFMEFPREQVTSLNIFTDEALIKNIHTKGDANAYLPKVEETYGKIILPKGKDYPYLFASIALSMDGKMAYPDNQDGDMLVHSNTQNSDGALADFFVLNFLRAYADAVLIGTKSMINEANEWITIYDEELVEDRKKHMPDKEEQPFTIVASKDGTDIPFDHLLFNQSEIPVLVFTSPVGFENIQKKAGDKFYLLEDVSKEGIYDNSGLIPVVVTGEADSTALKPFMRLMKLAGVDHIMVESPMINWLLMREGLLNEFFITYTSIFVGGTISPGYFSPATFDNHPQSKVAYMNRHENTFFYTRQILEEER